YPLYLIHYPLIYLYFGWQRTHADLPLQIHVFAGVSTFILSVALAWGVLRLYDEPVRRYLAARWLGKASR
ncbi:MAG: acyltransferase, partial [Muribaculaceae bacterium]|nr:acyltransferase [Muribaculaceae bacterium]